MLRVCEMRWCMRFACAFRLSASCLGGEICSVLASLSRCVCCCGWKIAPRLPLGSALFELFGGRIRVIGMVTSHPNHIIIRAH